MISSLGVGRLILVGGDKVEKAYFGSHLFRRPGERRRLLVEGLSQAEVDCRVPEVFVCKSIKKFLLDADEPGMLRSLYGDTDAADSSSGGSLLKLVAHPPLNHTLAVSGMALHQQRMQSTQSAASADVNAEADYFYTSQRFGEYVQQQLASAKAAAARADCRDTRLLLAVGPEGGWTQPELKLFVQQAGFAAVHVGERILRTDVAVPVLLGLAHDFVAQLRAQR